MDAHTVISVPAILSSIGAFCRLLTCALRKSKLLRVRHQIDDRLFIAGPRHRQLAEHGKHQQDERKDRQQRVVGDRRREGEIVAVVELDDAAVRPARQS